MAYLFGIKWKSLRNRALQMTDLRCFFQILHPESLGMLLEGSLRHVVITRKWKNPRNTGAVEQGSGTEGNC